MPRSTDVLPEASAAQQVRDLGMRDGEMWMGWKEIECGLMPANSLRVSLVSPL